MALASGAVEFSGHAVHSSRLLAPTAVENDPRGHFVHAADPVAALKRPAGHKVHAVPSGPVAPALQVQLVTDWLAAAVAEPEYAGHALHVRLETAPSDTHVPAAP